jgi:hypothetical protein
MAVELTRIERLILIEEYKIDMVLMSMSMSNKITLLKSSLDCITELQNGIPGTLLSPENVKEIKSPIEEIMPILDDEAKSDLRNFIQTLGLDKNTQDLAYKFLNIDNQSETDAGEIPSTDEPSTTDENETSTTANFNTYNDTTSEQSNFLSLNEQSNDTGITEPLSRSNEDTPLIKPDKQTIVGGMFPQMNFSISTAIPVFDIVGNAKPVITMLGPRAIIPLLTAALYETAISPFITQEEMDARKLNRIRQAELKVTESAKEAAKEAAKKAEVETEIAQEREIETAASRTLRRLNLNPRARALEDRWELISLANYMEAAKSELKECDSNILTAQSDHDRSLDELHAARREQFKAEEAAEALSDEYADVNSLPFKQKLFVQKLVMNAKKAARVAKLKADEVAQRHEENNKKLAKAHRLRDQTEAKIRNYKQEIFDYEVVDGTMLTEFAETDPELSRILAMRETHIKDMIDEINKSRARNAAEEAAKVAKRNAEALAKVAKRNAEAAEALAKAEARYHEQAALNATRTATLTPTDPATLTPTDLPTFTCPKECHDVLIAFREEELERAKEAERLAQEQADYNEFLRTEMAGVELGQMTALMAVFQLVGYKGYLKFKRYIDERSKLHKIQLYTDNAEVDFRNNLMIAGQDAVMLKIPDDDGRPVNFIFTEILYQRVFLEHITERKTKAISKLRTNLHKKEQLAVEQSAAEADPAAAAAAEADPAAAAAAAPDATEEYPQYLMTTNSFFSRDATREDDVKTLTVEETHAFSQLYMQEILKVSKKIEEEQQKNDDIIIDLLDNACLEAARQLNLLVNCKESIIVGSNPDLAKLIIFKLVRLNEEWNKMYTRVKQDVLSSAIDETNVESVNAIKPVLAYHKKLLKDTHRDIEKIDSDLEKNRAEIEEKQGTSNITDLERIRADLERRKEEKRLNLDISTKQVLAMSAAINEKMSQELTREQMKSNQEIAEISQKTQLAQVTNDGKADEHQRLLDRFRLFEHFVGAGISALLARYLNNIKFRVGTMTLLPVLRTFLEYLLMGEQTIVGGIYYLYSFYDPTTDLARIRSIGAVNLLGGIVELGGEGVSLLFDTFNMLVFCISLVFFAVLVSLRYNNYSRISFMGFGVELGSGARSSKPLELRETGRTATGSTSLEVGNKGSRASGSTSLKVRDTDSRASGSTSLKVHDKRDIGSTTTTNPDGSGFIGRTFNSMFFKGTPAAAKPLSKEVSETSSTKVSNTPSTKVSNTPSTKPGKQRATYDDPRALPNQGGGKKTKKRQRPPPDPTSRSNNGGKKTKKKKNKNTPIKKNKNTRHKKIKIHAIKKNKHTRTKN